MFQLHHTIQFDTAITTLAYSNDGTRVAIALGDAQVVIHDLIAFPITLHEDL
jgi:hypothetical protein